MEGPIRFSLLMLKNFCNIVPQGQFCNNVMRDVANRETWKGPYGFLCLC
jgi:hypothetical protein